MQRKFSLTLVLALIFCLAFPIGANAATAEAKPSAVMHLELTTYSTNTTKILVYWENTGNVEVNLDYNFQIEKKEDAKWVRVKPNEETNYNPVANRLQPGEARKMIYDLGMYSKKLTAGEYRISIYYFSYGARGESTSYKASKSFKIVDAKKFKGVSELDAKGLEKYDDVTGYDVFQNTSAHIYRNDETGKTILVYKGEQYSIAANNGRMQSWDAQYLKADGKSYIIYTYAWGLDKNQAYRSHVGAFNLTDRVEMYTSRGFYSDDIHIEQSEANPLTFFVSGTKVGPEYGRGYDGGYEQLGTLIYSGGKFTLDETKKRLG